MQKTREEQRKCSDRIETLEHERTETERQLETAEEVDNVYVHVSLVITYTPRILKLYLNAQRHRSGW